ncbi:unnamed protein product [Nesidiocoris tenuis]|uniref:Uncharacterized protein n=1 Tax=Nesidiocoris tenuis TaxID=355587 RepID=A0A6H5GAM1_9HEMI|nr:unnamed protein product [Nesidiocoris tenuis]
MDWTRLPMMRIANSNAPDIRANSQRRWQLQAARVAFRGKGRPPRVAGSVAREEPTCDRPRRNDRPRSYDSAFFFFADQFRGVRCEWNYRSAMPPPLSRRALSAGWFASLSRPIKKRFATNPPPPPRRAKSAWDITPGTVRNNNDNNNNSYYS